MKGKTAQQNLVLFPEKPCYPWQILEVEGETWLIVRWQEKVSTSPLQQINSVCGEEFTWDLIYDTAEKCFYRGKIVFQVSYQELAGQAKSLDVKEPWREEHLFNESLLRGKKQQKTFEEREDRNKGTGFSSLLLNQAEFNKQQKLGETGSKVWQVVLPWRCWLKGKGENEQPVLKKVHVAQVGLYTLLLEALIKLERKEEKRQSGTSVMVEETMFEITEDSVEEVIGLVMDRAWRRCFYDPRRKSLILSFLKKPFLIYLSTQKGGERFLIASNVKEELIEVKDYAEPLYPMEVEIRTEKVKLGLVSKKRIFYQGKNFYRVYQELALGKEDDLAKKAQSEIKEVSGPAKRSKPGEKWLKKKESLSNCNLKMVMSIKI